MTQQALRLLLRPAEAAEAIGISRAQLYKLVVAGELRGVHVGRSRRFAVHELEAWVQQKMEVER